MLWKLIVFKYVCIKYAIENTDFKSAFKIYEKCFWVILFCASIEYTFNTVGFISVCVHLPTCTDIYTDICLVSWPENQGILFFYISKTLEMIRISFMASLLNAVL